MPPTDLLCGGPGWFVIFSFINVVDCKKGDGEETAGEFRVNFLEDKTKLP